MDSGTRWALIVDNNEVSRLIFESHLASMGFATVLAKDSEDAMQSLGVNPFMDLIITDVMMPFLDGFDFTKKLKEYSVTKYIPLLGTSAIHDWQKSKDEGDLIVDGFVQKPVAKSALLAAITKVMNRPQMSCFR